MSTRPWIKSYGDVIPATINPDSVASVRDLLDGAMKTFADKPAFRSFGQTMTYADMDARSRAGEHDVEKSVRASSETRHEARTSGLHLPTLQ